MPKRGGKGKKGKKSGASSAAAASNKVNEPVATATSETPVEETTAKGEGEIEEVPTEAVETPTTTPAVAVPDNVTKTPETAAPELTVAASNAEEVPIPTVEEPPVQDVVDKAQTSQSEPIEAGETDALLPETTAKESDLTTESITSGAQETVPATTSLPERPKELDGAEEAHVKRPHENDPLANGAEQKPPKIPKMDDVPAAKTSSAEVPAAKEKIPSTIVLPSETVAAVQPQMVTGLGADPADKELNVLEVPGLSALNSKEVDAVADTSKKPQTAEAIAPTGAPTSAKEAILPERKEPEVAKDQEAPSAIEPLATKPATKVGVLTADTATEEEAKTVPATQEPSVANPTAAVAKEETETVPAAPKEPAVTKPAAAAAGTTGASTSGFTKEKAVDVSKPQQDAPAAFSATAASHNTTGAKGVSQQQETPVVTKPPAAVTHMEKPLAMPVVNQPTAAATAAGAADKSAGASKSTTEQPKSVGLPSNVQTQPEKPSGLSESAAAARAATQKSQQAKNVEPQAAQGAHDASAPTTAEPEEGKTSTEQAQKTDQENAQQESANADKRKSGGFWAWVKRKVKGT